ncbi:MAG TPA: hypothetical protein VFA26_25930 [Gemmataceae bacterium]|nr:hypothetical protein [Gemmataceae bacterium]
MSLLKREECACGHGGHQHLPRLLLHEGRVVLLPGLGTCSADGCDCERFHFRRWVSVPRVRRRARQVVHA